MGRLYHGIVEGKKGDYIVIDVESDIGGESMSVRTFNQSEVIKKITEILNKTMKDVKKIVKEYSPIDKMEEFRVFATSTIDSNTISVKEHWIKGRKI